jgi:hypothetical protein
LLVLKQSPSENQANADLVYRADPLKEAIMSRAVVAFSMLFAAAFAQADEIEVVPYTYHTKMDVAQVLSIETPEGLDCAPVTAVMTYRDSKGEVHKMSYQKFSDSCMNENG